MFAGLLIAMAAAGGVAAPASASCAPVPPAKQRLAGADAAFVGALLSRRDGGGGRAVLTFRVDRAYKGPLGQQVDVTDSRATTSIGLRVAPGEVVGLLLHGRPGAYSAIDCDRIPPEALEDATSGRCRTAVRPPRHYRRRPPEPNLRYGVRPRVIGCGQAPGGHRYQLVGYRLARKGQRLGSLCIDTVWQPRLASYGCEDNRIRGGRVVEADGVVRGGGRPTFITGSVDPFAAAVRITYRVHDTQASRAGSIVHVRDRRRLRHLHVRRPFAIYVAELPVDAQPLEVVALGPFGHRLGAARFR
jgi:hypothetical protein